MKPEIIEKIKKLLALATSSNENEAKLAAAKAQELLVAHNLDMQTVNLSDNSYDHDILFEVSKSNAEYKYVSWLINKYFFVMTIQTQFGHKRIYRVVGEKANIEIASYMSEFFFRAFRECFVQYRKDNGVPLEAKADFYFGFYEGIKTQLEASRKKVEDSKGLVVIKDPKIREYAISAIGPIASVKTSVSTRGYDSVREAGFEKGRELNISRGIGGPSIKSGKLIGK